MDISRSLFYIIIFIDCAPLNFTKINLLLDSKLMVNIMQSNLNYDYVSRYYPRKFEDNINYNFTFGYGFFFGIYNKFDYIKLIS